ncbi:hypothetical protein EG327_011605 [Venturia inaequalis]|uniref:Uncharacterized protein n=1 Tax=Venturia inaequalis TaxID=5025 RepID=A0A8H3YNG3_VENIN|nr:hypothetical protein EG327_011605 [Venturia inaequalis]
MILVPQFTLARKGGITSRPGSSMGLVESNLLAPRSAASPTSQVNQRTSDVRPIMSRDAFQLRPPSAAILTNEGQTVEQEGTSEQVKTREAKRRKGATHGKVIKYFCDESGCPRQSEGFKRRDHLKQHLSGVHKRTLGRFRTQDSTTMSTLSPTEATSSSTSSQSQPPQPPPSAVALGKRKRESAMHEQETQDSEIAWQLTSGRRLQMLMHEVKELREQVERYRGKYLELDLLGGGST